MSLVQVPRGDPGTNAVVSVPPVNVRTRINTWNLTTGHNLHEAATHRSVEGRGAHIRSRGLHARVICVVVMLSRGPVLEHCACTITEKSVQHHGAASDAVNVHEAVNGWHTISQLYI